jgi:hypothetical protein
MDDPISAPPRGQTSYWLRGAWLPTAARRLPHVENEDIAETRRRLWRACLERKARQRKRAQQNDARDPAGLRREKVLRPSRATRRTNPNVA